MSDTVIKQVFEDIEEKSKDSQVASNLVIPEISKLRLAQNYSELVGVRKALVAVPVRKPGRQEFVRTHPDESYRIETAVIELKEERETYLVDPSLWQEIPGDLSPKSSHQYH